MTIKTQTIINLHVKANNKPKEIDLKPLKIYWDRAAGAAGTDKGYYYLHVGGFPRKVVEELQKHKIRYSIHAELIFTFPEKPSPDLRSMLKDRGFHWNKFQGIWWKKIAVPITTFPDGGYACSEIDRNPDVIWAKTLTNHHHENNTSIRDYLVEGEEATGEIGVTVPDTPTTTKPSSAKQQSLASKLRGLADGMQGKIDHCFHERQENTTRRQRIASGIRKEGYKMQKVQSCLRSLATVIEQGTCPDLLTKIATKTQVEALLTGATFGHGFRDGGEWYLVHNHQCLIKAGINEQNFKNAYETLLRVDDRIQADTQEELLEQQKAEARKKKRQELMNAGFPGFVPTPLALANEAVSKLPWNEFKGTSKIMRILEPSAGAGNLIKRIFNYAALKNVTVEVWYCETSYALGEYLREEFGNSIQGLGTDFLRVYPNTSITNHIEPFDAIIQNPPFENYADIDHFSHALKWLKPGGTIVSIHPSTCLHGMAWRGYSVEDESSPAPRPISPPKERKIRDFQAFLKQNDAEYTYILADDKYCPLDSCAPGTIPPNQSFAVSEVPCKIHAYLVWMTLPAPSIDRTIQNAIDILSFVNEEPIMPRKKQPEQSPALPTYYRFGSEESGNLLEVLIAAHPDGGFTVTDMQNTNLVPNGEEVVNAPSAMEAGQIIWNDYCKNLKPERAEQVDVAADNALVNQVKLAISTILDFNRAMQEALDSDRLNETPGKQEVSVWLTWQPTVESAAETINNFGRGKPEFDPMPLLLQWGYHQPYQLQPDTAKRLYEVLDKMNNEIAEIATTYYTTAPKSNDLEQTQTLETQRYSYSMAEVRGGDREAAVGTFRLVAMPSDTTYIAQQLTQYSSGDASQAYWTKEEFEGLVQESVFVPIIDDPDPDLFPALLAEFKADVNAAIASGDCDALIALSQAALEGALIIKELLLADNSTT